MSAAGCLPDTPVLCRAHSDMPEHNRNWIRSGTRNQWRKIYFLYDRSVTEKQKKTYKRHNFRTYKLLYSAHEDEG